MGICWQRYYMFDIIEANEIEYDQVLMVDADTIVHPDCPDFFKESEGKFCAVMNDGCYEWVTRSIKKYGDYFSELYTDSYFSGHFAMQSDWY
jgi:lipopolysaccharide biosynthesis glycosyltransferase